MSLKQLDTKTLDEILAKMIETVSSSKNEIFQIGEQCRKDYESVTVELLDIKQTVGPIIEKADKLEIDVGIARNRLAEITKSFKDFSEIEVREAYEKAYKLQMDLTLNRQYEKQMRQRRDDLERRMLGLHETIKRAEHLVSQISVVMNYLQSDITQMGEALETAKLKQDFGLKIIEAQEDERKRLSREIHDGPAQMLANVMMRSDLIERIYRERSSEEAIEEIRNLKKMVRSALYEVRRIIYDLRPMALDDLGLVPTLRKYLQTIEEYHKTTKISFSIYGEDKRIPTKFEVTLFRLIQESVQNAFKHANANKIEVRLEITNTAVTVLVKDDGVGFDPKEMKADAFGIIGMKERVELIEGELILDSEIGAGTIIRIRVPLTFDVK